jgi:hypothetical protein
MPQSHCCFWNPARSHTSGSSGSSDLKPPSGTRLSKWYQELGRKQRHQTTICWSTSAWYCGRHTDIKLITKQEWQLRLRNVTTSLHRNNSINNFDTVSYAYALFTWRDGTCWKFTDFRESLHVPHSRDRRPINVVNHIPTWAALTIQMGEGLEYITSVTWDLAG